MSFASLSQHQAMVSERLRHMRGRLTDKAGISNVTVSFTSGLQSGMTRCLQTNALSFGSGADNDIVLMDERISDVHLQIALERTAFGTVANVTTFDQPVTVNGDLLAPGEQRASVPLPVSLKLGGAQITLGGSGKAESLRRARKSKSFLYFDPVLSFAGVLLCGLFLSTVMVTHSESKFGRHEVIVNDPVTTTPVAVVAERDWMSEIQAQLVTTMLYNELAVASDSNQLIRISGLVPISKLTSLRDLQTWYDSQKGAPTVIWEVRRESELSKMPPVTMVRMTHPQHVLLSNGSIVRPGEVILGEWVLSEIEETGIVLTRGSERTKVGYRELVP